MSGTLYIIGTPIGNLEDLTLRAIRILKEVDLIYAEDTRVTRKLLDRYEISNSLHSYRESADRTWLERTIKEIIYQLESGKNLAYVSDAGTPGVSDPGAYLVSRILQAGAAKVVPIPGVSAFATLLSVCGLPVYRPLFAGFLPKKKRHKTVMEGLKHSLSSDMTDSLIFYESPERILKLLQELLEWGIPLQVCLGRELTKLHEEILRGSLSDVLAELQDRKQIKGEITLIVSRQDE